MNRATVSVSQEVYRVYAPWTQDPGYVTPRMSCAPTLASKALMSGSHSIRPPYTTAWFYLSGRGRQGQCEERLLGSWGGLLGSGSWGQGLLGSGCD